MKVLRRFVNLLLLFWLASMHLAGVAHAQYGAPGDNAAQERPAAGEFDYVADVESTWVAEFGEADGAGDWRYDRHPLFDAAHEAQIGWADGYCVQTAPGEWAYCNWSLYADTWTLSAHGIYDEATGNNWFAIAGGTGDYQDIHGYLHVATSPDATSNSTQLYFTVEAQELTAYAPLTVNMPTENWQPTFWGDPAASYGNVWYWYDVLYDETGDTQIGWTSGYCVWTSPNYAAECIFTIWGDGWAISASGVQYDTGASTLSITGGYGDYAGATGTVRWTVSESSPLNELVFTFDFIPTTLYKPYAVDFYGGQLYADLPPADEPAGDVYYRHSLLWDAVQGTRIGWTDGYCVILAPDAWSTCTVTFYTDTWTLTASGPAYETGEPSRLAVTGGTGAYADVAGYIVLTPNEDTSTSVTFEVDVAPYTYWQNVAWEQVTEEDAAHWYTLGWNETNWDGSLPAAVPESVGRTWAELTPVEQEAATALGYDESTWNPSAVRVPEGDASALWDTIEWDDLYLSEQRLWGILGWHAGNWSGIPEAAMPASNWRTWNQLTPVEQGAATTLGYDESTWGAEPVRTPEGEGAEIELFWSQFAWEELSYGEQQLFAYLGWDAARWLGDAPLPESKYRFWAELSPVEKGAAIQLGYDEASWDVTVLER